MRRTSVSRRIGAPCERVYDACVDPDRLPLWRAPDGMTATIQWFDARVGGSYRMTLTYDDPRGAPGKSDDASDSFNGRFLELVPGERVVEAVTFDARDPQFAGEMRMITLLADADDGTEVTMVCENLPPGIRLEDNEQGTAMSLAKLARLVE